MTSTAPNRRNGVYPDGDGQSMADHTKQFRWIVIIKENLELLFADRQQADAAEVCAQEMEDLLARYRDRFGELP
ncbi:MAG TPA: hypothetical protein V6C88_07530 [Chroococcidiopsis sp.]